MIIVTEVAEKEFIAQKLSSKGAVLALKGKVKHYNLWKDVKKVHPKAGNIGWGLTTWSEKPIMTAKMYGKIVNAPIEEVLCLATLVASGTIPSSSATLEFSKRHFDRGDGCDRCCAKNRCLAIIINE